MKVAIDTLTYKFNVMREDPADVTDGPDDGIYCHGLWLEGGRMLPGVFKATYVVGIKLDCCLQLLLRQTRQPYLYVQGYLAQGRRGP